MNPLASLFQKSPFKPLQEHMRKVISAVDRLPALLAAVLENKGAERDALVDEVCRLESEADEIKHALFDHLPHSRFLPVDRRDVLSIVRHQDLMADIAQDFAILLSFRKSALPPALHEPAARFVAEVVELCRRAARVVDELDELLETSFGGPEASKAFKMIAQVDVDEPLTDGHWRELARMLFAHEAQIGPVDTMYWFHAFRRAGEVAYSAEGACDCIRLLLAR